MRQVGFLLFSRLLVKFSARFVGRRRCGREIKRVQWWVDKNKSVGGSVVELTHRVVRGGSSPRFFLSPGIPVVQRVLKKTLSSSSSATSRCVSSTTTSKLFSSTNEHIRGGRGGGAREEDTHGDDCFHGVRDVPEAAAGSRRRRGKWWQPGRDTFAQNATAFLRMVCSTSTIPSPSPMVARMKYGTRQRRKTSR